LVHNWGRKGLTGYIWMDWVSKSLGIWGPRGRIFLDFAEGGKKKSFVSLFKNFKVGLYYSLSFLIGAKGRNLRKGFLSLFFFPIDIG